MTESYGWILLLVKEKDSWSRVRRKENVDMRMRRKIVVTMSGAIAWAA